MSVVDNKKDPKDRQGPLQRIGNWAQGLGWIVLLLLAAMVQEMAEALMGAEVDALCGAPYGERSPERVNRRNGYRERDWDTRVGSIELAMPKLREGSYFPDWLLQPRRRAEQASNFLCQRVSAVGLSLASTSSRLKPKA